MTPLARQTETALAEAPALNAASFTRIADIHLPTAANDAAGKAQTTLLERRRRRTNRRSAHA